jgi:Sec-independent protein translocase protein TatA
MQAITANVPILALPFGGWEIFVVAAFVLILLGFKRLPDFLRGLRQGIHEFRKASGSVLGGLDQQAGDAGKSLGGIHGKLAAEALTTDNHTVELYDPDVLRDRERADGAAKKAARRQFFFSRAASKGGFLSVLMGAALKILLWPLFIVQRWRKRVKRQT